MAWTNNNFPFGSVLTSAKMTAVQDNFAALAQGLSGAPSILSAAFSAGAVDQAAIGASAVGQGELKIGLSDIGTTNIALTHYTNSSGLYGFWPNIQMGAGYLHTHRITVAYSPASTGVDYSVVAINTSNAAGVAHSHQNYVQASPPYDLGDGQIHQFVQVVIDKTTGKPISVSSAPDPVWANNGPTPVNPLGRLCCHPLLRKNYYDLTSKEQKEYDAEIERIKSLSIEEKIRHMFEPMNQQEKNKDMELIPHGFSEYDPSKHVIAFINPLGLFNEKMHDVCTYGGDHMSDIILNEKMIIDNDDMGIVCPRQCIPVKARFKNTRR